MKCKYSLLHLLLSSQLSTQEVWKRWRQASRLTMLPARKSPRQITQWGLPSFTRPPPSLGLNFDVNSREKTENRFKNYSKLIGAAINTHVVSFTLLLWGCWPCHYVPIRGLRGQYRVQYVFSNADPNLQKHIVLQINSISWLVQNGLAKIPVA